MEDIQTKKLFLFKFAVFEIFQCCIQLYYRVFYLTVHGTEQPEFHIICSSVFIRIYQIFRKRIYSLPKYKTINCHAGKLPFYRGRNILNWALINDEKEFGITVHYVDDGIDTGDIILQKSFPITDADTYSTLLNTAYEQCPTLLYEAIKQIQGGTAMRIPQSLISSHGLYCGMRSVGDEILNWNQTSREVFNFVRAICQPGPMAICYNKDVPVYINRVFYDADFPIYKGIPGQVLAIIDGYPVVKTLDSYVILQEYISTDKIKVGNRLTSQKHD